MRTRDTIIRARQHLLDAARGAMRAGDREVAAKVLPMVDLLSWVLLDASNFETDVMGPCDVEDRAARQ